MSFGYIPSDKKWKNFILKPLGWMNLIRRMQAPTIMRMLHLQPNDIVLDVGCGNGNFAVEVAKRVKKVIGLDLTISQYHEKISEQISNLTFIRHSALSLPFGNESFDKILLSSVLQMAKEDNLLLQECNRVLKKGKDLVLSVPVGYVYLSKFFNCENGFCGGIKKILNLPNDYSCFKKELNCKFGVEGKGYYSFEELNDILQRNRFDIIQYEYAPKKIGSFLYEALLIFRFVLKLPLSSRSHFLFYLVGYFDRFFGKQTKGCEIIVKAKKARVFLNEE